LKQGGATFDPAAAAPERDDSGLRNFMVHSAGADPVCAGGFQFRLTGWRPAPGPIQPSRSPPGKRPLDERTRLNPPPTPVLPKSNPSPPPLAGSQSPAVTVNPIFTPQSHSEAPARPVPPEPRMQRRACVSGHWGIVRLLPRLQTTLEPTGQDRGRYHATVAQRSLSCGSQVQLPGPWTWIQKSRLSAAPRAATSRNTGSIVHESLHEQPRNLA
jgi:hypothetical protein